MLNPNIPHYLSVSVSYKKEAWNLIEWLEYHIIVGVNHFYIYINDENPKFSNSILKPYMEEGFVTIVNSARMFTNSHNRQASAHHHALARAVNKTRWLAMLDMDEFLYPVVENTVSNVLRNYHESAQLLVNYACFGSSGHEFRPELQTSVYLKRARDGWEWNKLCKGIGQVQHLRAARHHHFFQVLPGRAQVDEDKKHCGWVKNYKGKYLRINHYLTRSREDYMEKMKRGNPIGEKRDWNWFNWANRNEVYDDGLWTRFGEQLLYAVNRRRSLLNYSRKKITIL